MLGEYMKMQKRLFRIGDLAQKLEVEKFVIRFWEKEFNFKSHRSDGGQRFYSIEDFEQFKQIKTLLYERGFTIAGAKKELCKETTKAPTHGARKTTIESEKTGTHELEASIKEKMLLLQKQLIKLKELL